MNPSSTLSQAALAAGVPQRYHYWQGRSGRRYLFTSADPGSLADFEVGVAIAVRQGRIVWSGEIRALLAGPMQVIPNSVGILVHLLAATDEERRLVIEDLRPGPQDLRLAA